MGVFGIIFGNKSLNTGRIKNGHISPGRINRLAYGFGKIHKMIKDILKVSKEILLETGDFGSIFINTLQLIIQSSTKYNICQDITATGDIINLERVTYPVL